MALSAHIRLGKNTIFSHTSSVFSSSLGIFFDEKPTVILLQSHDTLKQILILIVQTTEEGQSDELVFIDLLIDSVFLTSSSNPPSQEKQMIGRKIDNR